MKIFYGTFRFYLRNIYNTLKQIIRLCVALPLFFRESFKIKRKLGEGNDFSRFSMYPCLLDRNAEGGTATGHYFHQDLWVAQQIFKSNPVKHVDIGSRVDGFVAHVASFRFIEVLDVRPINNVLDNIAFVQADLMLDSSHLVDYCDSISCLHALEHFGLGRYGDTMDVDGHLKGFANISKMLKPGGIFYFSVPIGPRRIEFNAHRVFDIKYLLNMFEGKYIVDSFFFVDDKGNLNKDVLLDEKRVAENFGCNWGCGIFKLVKV